MTDGQLAFDSQYDLVCEEASSHTTIHDPWNDAPKATLGTFTPPTWESDSIELPSTRDRWGDDSVTSDVTTSQKWGTKWANSGATSPYRLFLAQLDPDVSFDTVLAYVRYGLNRENGEELAERLSELRSDLAEEEESLGLSMLSLLGFVGFLRLNPKLRDSQYRGRKFRNRSRGVA